MANSEQLAIFKKGVQAWNKWRNENPEKKVDLTRVNLNSQDLRNVDLSEADLTSANLKGAKLTGANFASANLTRANLGSAELQTANLMIADLQETILHKANLFGAILSGSDLRDADLREADLTVANLSQAKLEKTNFSLAVVGATVFGSIDLRGAIGLDTIDHLAPSTIGLDSIVISQGKIPDIFLRGCGLSNWDIEKVMLYNPDLEKGEIDKVLGHIYGLRTGEISRETHQISSLFISYSHADSEFADKLSKCLDNKGIRYWRDIHEMKAGRVEKQIDRAIRKNPTVLLILSRNSLRSDWVQHEVRMARQMEKDLDRDVLCPIALDNSWQDNRWPQRIMEQIMEYIVLDFSEWQDDVKFEITFHKLIDGLELFYKK